jgi:hypothetical protein
MILPEIRSKRTKPTYHKSLEINELELLATADARLKHPTLPEHALLPRKYRDDTANSLTACIVAYITLTGGWASRIGNQGTYKKSLGRCIPGTSKKGLADVNAVFNGLSLHIEVKIAKRKAQVGKWDEAGLLWEKETGNPK